MKKKQLLLIAIAIIGFNVPDLSAQNRKQIIEALQIRTDSLEKALNAKVAAMHALEVKFAKLEGASEIRDEVAKKAEAKADSLLTTLKEKDTVIATLNKQLADLNTEADRLKTESKALSDQNEALTAELSGFKKAKEINPASPTVTESKPAAVIEKRKEAVAPKETAVSVAN